MEYFCQERLKSNQMASQLDAKFFRKAKKANRAVEITDTQAFIPAVKDSAEIRVQLPNRRIRTIEERETILEERHLALVTLEEEIEIERKSLLSLIQSYRLTGNGITDIVALNLKIKILMEKRSKLSRPEKWIEELEGLNFKDVFASKRDVRKIGASVFQVKRRVEPITGLYVDLGNQAVAAEVPVVAPPLTTVKTVAKPKTTEEIAQGAIIGKRVLQSKKTVAKPATGLGSIIGSVAPKP